MPIIKSAKKRVKVAARQSSQNAKTKKNLRTALKELQASIISGKKITESQTKVQSAIDTAVKKGVLSKGRAARLNSRTNQQAKTATGGKRTVTKKAPAKKVATKKPATKKAPAKKTAVKKTQTKKKPAAKKSASK